MAVKGLLSRVRRLEPKPSRILLKIGGSFEKFDAEIEAGMASGKYDPLDMPTVAYCVKKWAMGDLS
ncbi:hypothetical protein SAMN02990966_07454 [Rhodospirillales bacterium URHD0017]|nr:hypothetical protein SAMN02990966_07454 [Rhodospirillales bacterium URHD0017]